MRLVLLACLLLCLPVWGQIYKWTDSTGKTIYGDKPPEETKAQEIRIQSHEQPVEVKDWSKVLRARSASGPAPASGVTMFSTSWCGHCKRARAYFASKGISYTDIDVEKSADGRRRFKEFGGGGVPLILVGNRTMRGFSPGGFEALRK